MCRAQGDGCGGGRRCHPSVSAREAALGRRRQNRAIGQQIQRWAKAEGKSQELAEMKRQRKAINDIKAWAEEAGAPAEVYAIAQAPAKKGWEAAKTVMRNEPGKAGAAPAPSPASSSVGPIAPGAGALRGGLAAAGAVSPAAAQAPAVAGGESARGPHWNEWKTQCGAQEAERVALLVQRQGLSTEEQQLLRMDRAREGAPVAQQGVNGVTRLVYNDGSCGYFKSYAGLSMGTARLYGHEGRLQPAHEAAASQFAQTLGSRYAALVPPVVLAQHKGQWGSISYGVPGHPVGSASRVKGTSEHHAQQADDMGFFDCLIGQVDRHGGNALYDRRGVSAIDNGFAFTDGVGGVNASIFVTDRARDSKRCRLTSEERQTLSRFLESEDGLGLRGTIEEGRFHEVRRRAKLMQTRGRIVNLADLYPSS